jgi:DNA polymerase-3 subunit epsilon
MQKYLFFDTETTGVTDTDEILEIAIIDQDGNVLLDTYVTPERHTCWDSAMQTNKITPEFIFAGNFPKIGDLTEQITQILAGQEVVTYGMEFDAAMLENNGIDLRSMASVHCAMNRMAIWNGEPSRKPYHKTGYRSLNLGVAADLAGYTWEGPAHKALSDARAAKAVWEFLDEQGPVEPEIVVL